MTSPKYPENTRIIMENRKHNIRKIAVGKPSKVAFGPGKVLMLVGATGSGKSTLINGFVNYIMGVRYEDDHRYKLIKDKGASSQAHSQTKCITAYTFYKGENSKLPYTLTIIDTPGYGDTKGLERDRKITKQIKEFFSIKGKQGIDQLHGIGFVVKAPDCRLTQTQRYIFDSIFSIFGKDIVKNIFMLITFADGNKPPVLAAIKEANFEFQSHFKFNNSALSPDDDDDDDDDDEDSFNQSYWKIGEKSFKRFFDAFGKTESVSLQLTREVLNEREKLQCIIEGLHPQIKAGLSKVDQLRQEERILKIHEKDLMTNKDFTYVMDVTKQKKITLPVGECVTNCNKCNRTCHHPCYIPPQNSKRHCAAMESDTGLCTICPHNCDYTLHSNSEYRYEYHGAKETKTSAELKKRYEEAASKKSEKESIMSGLSRDLEIVYRAVFSMISKAKRIIQRLDEIAYRPNPLSEVEYIDLLIESEEAEAKEGWTRRVAVYRDVRKQAEMLSKIKAEDEKTFEAQSDKTIAAFLTNFY